MAKTPRNYRTRSGSRTLQDSIQNLESSLASNGKPLHRTLETLQPTPDLRDSSVLQSSTITKEKILLQQGNLNRQDPHVKLWDKDPNKY